VDWIQHEQDMKAAVIVVINLWSLRVMKFLLDKDDHSFLKNDF
jgi:hypothetical protein